MRYAVLAAAASAMLAGAVPAAHAAPRAAVGGPLLDRPGVTVAPLAGAPALPTHLRMGSWLVADADTGAVLAAKDAHRQFLPASTLKTLTAVTLLPLLDPAQTTVATAADANVDGSKVGLVPGMSYTIGTLFTALMVVSGNDAAGALAEAAGGVPHTLDLMNAEAQRLRAYDTVARTPSGLDAAGEHSSAYDLALIARAGLAMPAFRQYVGTVRAVVPAPHHKHFQIYTHNRLLTTYAGDVGVKNGYTVKAGATYVGAATRGGHTILVTLMHAQPGFWRQARQLLDWGFAARERVTPVGTLVSPVPEQQANSGGPAQARPALSLPTPDRSATVPSWEVATLAASTGVLLVVSSRRLRRRRARLSLPPF